MYVIQLIKNIIILPFSTVLIKPPNKQVGQHIVTGKKYSMDINLTLFKMRYVLMLNDAVNLCFVKILLYCLLE